MNDKLERLLSLGLSVEKVYKKLTRMKQKANCNNLDYEDMISNLKLLKECEDKIYNSICLEEKINALDFLKDNPGTNINESDYMKYNNYRRVCSRLIDEVEREDPYLLGNENLEYNSHLGNNYYHININNNIICVENDSKRLFKINSLASSYIYLRYLNEMGVYKNYMYNDMFILCYLNNKLENILLDVKFNLDEELIRSRNFYNLSGNEVIILDNFIKEHSEEDFLDFINSYLELDNDDLEGIDLPYEECYLKGCLRECDIAIINNAYIDISSHDSENQTEVVKFLLDAIADYINENIKKKTKY